MAITSAHLSRLVLNSGGTIDGYGVLLAFQPDARQYGIDVELSQVGHCVVDDALKRISLYPTLVGDESLDDTLVATISDLVAQSASLIENRSDYTIRMYRRLLSVDPLRGGGELPVLGTLVLHDESEVWLLPTVDSQWAVDAAAL